MATTCPDPTQAAARLVALPDVLNVRDLSRALGITSQTTRRLLRSGALPGRRIGKTWLVVREDLLDALHAPVIRCADCRAEVGFATRGDGTELRTCDTCAEQLRAARSVRA